MFEETCAELASRLRERAPELKAGLANLVEGVDAPRDDADPSYLDYLDSLHANRVGVLGYVVDVIEVGERRARAIPPTVLSAARLAARADVPLTAVLRRYSAGNALFTDILVEEAERIEISAPDLRRLLQRQATTFDRLHEAVSEEYTREAQGRPTDLAGWRHEYIDELLAGRQPRGEVELDYDLGGHHLGLMARGEHARELARELAKRFDRRLLVDPGEEEGTWAFWLGGRQTLGTEEVLRALRGSSPSSVVIGVGETGEGVSGWRLTHRQAKVTLPIAEDRGQLILRYADVAVLASVLRDDLATASLRRLYLEPLEAARDGGAVWRQTLRAYFAAERNLSSTAAALGVDRRTVANRIRAIEELFDRPLSRIAADLETALQLAA